MSLFYCFGMKEIVEIDLAWFSVDMGVVQKYPVDLPDFCTEMS